VAHADSAPARTQLELELDIEQFLTNDIVKLEDAVVPENRWPRRLLKLNGGDPFKISTRGALILLLLICRARSNAGLPAPHHAPGPKFITAEAIADALPPLIAGIPSLRPTNPDHAFWINITAEEVREEIARLRHVIAWNHGNPQLIQTNPAVAGGYRLSTPADKLMAQALR
jgi:hypothetical protein